MTFAISDLVLICLLSLAFIHWHESQKVKEIAYIAVRSHCAKMDLQMLDDYVALNALWLKRDSHGKLRFWRCYAFEYTITGDDRHNGKIVLLGKLIEFIQLQPPH